MLICGGNNVRFDKTSRKVTQIDGKDVNKMTYIAPMNQCRNMFKAVCLKGEVYVFGGQNNAYNLVKSVEKYSPSTNTWKSVSVMVDERKNFCACAIMDKIFVLGGSYLNYETINSCIQFDTRDRKWKLWMMI